MTQEKGDRLAVVHLQVVQDQVDLAPGVPNEQLQLVRATAKHLRSVQRQPERIKRYFEHEPIHYAA